MSKQAMEEKNNQSVKSRRAFLKGAGLAGAAGVAAAVSIVASKPAQAAVDVKPSGTASYQETDHVKAYYAAAKF